MYEPSRRQRVLAVVAAASGVLATALHVLAGAAAEQVTGFLVGVTVAATLLVLYIHGQRRDPDDGDDVDDETKRKQKEMEAEAGGYGGNAGH